MDLIARLCINRQQITPNQAHGFGKFQHKGLPYLLLFHPS
jgi:hypothetical protein